VAGQLVRDRLDAHAPLGFEQLRADAPQLRGFPPGEARDRQNTEHLKAIHEFAIPGKVYASFQFSSALVLESDKYAIEFAGVVAVSDDTKLDVFQVNRHQDAFEL
jgi:hypothetical protein